MAHDRVAVLQEMMALRSGDPARADWFAPVSRALTGLTPTQAAWRPGAGLNTIWQIVNHLTFWTRFLARRLAGEAPTGVEIDNDETFGAPGDPADADGWARAVRGLGDAYSALEAVLARQADADLERPLNSRGTRAVSMVSGSVMHDAYHIGQIVLLRKLQGCWS